MGRGDFFARSCSFALCDSQGDGIQYISLEHASNSGRLHLAQHTLHLGDSTNVSICANTNGGCSQARWFAALYESIQKVLALVYFAYPG